MLIDANLAKAIALELIELRDREVELNKRDKVMGVDISMQLKGEGAMAMKIMVAMTFLRRALGMSDEEIIISVFMAGCDEIIEHVHAVTELAAMATDAESRRPDLIQRTVNVNPHLN